MPAFTYKATDASGRVVKGTVDARDERAAAAQLQDSGFIPMQIRPGGRSMGKMAFRRFEGIGGLLHRVSAKDVMLFTQDLSALLKAGLPLDRALGILIDTLEKQAMRDIVQDILKSVQGGSDLSNAISKHPGPFSDFYINMVRAGEAGGVLEAVLDRLGLFLESSQELRDFIKSALVYPVFLVLVGGVSIIILMTFVIPKFSMIFSDLGASIPFSTRLLIGTSAWLKSYGWTLLVGACAVVIGYGRFAGTPSGRLRIDRFKLTFPLMGELIRKIEVARFARTLGTLVRSGVPILQALRLVKDTIGNQVISRALDQVHNRVKEGDRLSRSLEHARIFPFLAIQMITVGEEAGKLEEMLLRVAENYEKVVRNLVKRFVSLLEPMMILCMGLVVGFIVISMLMAIFSMNDMPF
ncbi:type II secretion system inner membrane protein GspF [Desulfococcus sp.]|uniref:type II secretion system inner membrane protein GspF n=1 Tax=Desulfococcus sp. TaxID=2025834 RepID=UPI003594740B